MPWDGAWAGASLRKEAGIYGDWKALRAHCLGLKSRGHSESRLVKHKAGRVQAGRSLGYTLALHPRASFLCCLIKANGHVAPCLQITVFNPCQGKFSWWTPWDITWIEEGRWSMEFCQWTAKLRLGWFPMNQRSHLGEGGGIPSLLNQPIWVLKGKYFSERCTVHVLHLAPCYCQLSLW